MKHCIKGLVLIFTFVTTVQAQSNWQEVFDKEAKEIENKVIEWRREFHQNPELGNQENRTAGIVAAHLKTLGIEVKENVAVTGVIGILKGDIPGPVIALRADMDALPVTERTPLPFKSTVKVNYKGSETGVSHACGHDSHIAILMGVAEILSKHKAELKGTVKFYFNRRRKVFLVRALLLGQIEWCKRGLWKTLKLRPFLDYILILKRPLDILPIDLVLQWRVWISFILQ